MTGTVAVGGAWLAAQGPREPREHCVRCLELGYNGIVPAPGSRPMQWGGFPRALEDLPLTIPAVRAEAVFEPAGGSLASARAEDLWLVRQRVARSAELAQRLCVPLLIVEAPAVPLAGAMPLRLDTPSDVTAEDYGVLEAKLEANRGRFLDRICRNLHQICGELPDFRLCLTESADLCSSSRAADLAEILADLARFRLGYWHRPALVARRAALGGTAHGAVLELLSKYLCGSDLSDSGPAGLQGVPGSGGVDYGLVAPYTGALSIRLPTVVELDPACHEEEMRHGRAFLGKFGL